MQELSLRTPLQPSAVHLGKNPSRNHDPILTQTSLFQSPTRNKSRYEPTRTCSYKVNTLGLFSRGVDVV